MAADVRNRASLDRLLASVDLLINCAGPYASLGLPVAEAALAARVPVFDLSGEQVYLRLCERLHEEAGKAGVVIGNSMGVEVALSDCAAALAARDLAVVAEVRVAGAVKGFRMSPATRVSALGAICAEGVTREEGRLLPVHVAYATRRFGFSAPFGPSTCAWYPGVEILTIPRHLPAPRVATYARVPGWSRLPLKWMGRVAGGSTAALLTRSTDALKIVAGRVGGTPGVTRPACFEIRVELLGTGAGGQEERHLSVAALDPYGLSAEIVVLAARRLLEAGAAAGHGGVLSPSQVVDPGWLFAKLGKLDAYRFECRRFNPFSQEPRPPEPSFPSPR